jgi:hypothetical protein
MTVLSVIFLIQVVLFISQIQPNSTPSIAEGDFSDNSETAQTV